MKAKNVAKRLVARQKDYDETFPRGVSSKGFKVHRPGSNKK